MYQRRPVLITLALAAVASWDAWAEEVWPEARWQTATPGETGMDEAALRRAREYALTGKGSGYVTRGGKLVMAWGDPDRRYDLKSTTKAIGVTALGLAIADGKIALDDKAKRLHPSLGAKPRSNVETGWLDEITIFHLATQTAGFDKPGGYTKLLFRPGTKWSYSDGGPNWLAECVTLAYRRDVRDLLFDRVFEPIGIRDSDLTWRKNAYREDLIDGVKRREFGSGISANVDAMARIGYLYLRGGRWNDRQLLPREFVDRVRAPLDGVVGLPEQDPATYGNASDHYGLLWWNNGDGTLAGVPRDAYWSWGLYDSLIVVIPSLDVVVSRAGASWERKSKDHYAVLEPFLKPIAASVRTSLPSSSAGFPPSRSIVGVGWSPACTIVRKAAGSDNWPLTWADDGAMYAAYGDGRGFEPKAPKKLSLGFAKIEGSADAFKGVNIRAPSGEQTGDGARGKKASGMLMVDGVLYMWARNADNSQLAWSADHARTWKWTDWRFTDGFGCPTFLNFGRDYAGARDDYVYVYSPDAQSAYVPADRVTFARVPTERIRERDAYEFLAGTGDAGRPRWTRDISQRGAAFARPKGCYRVSVSYNAGLKRYLWSQALPGGDTRFEGGLAVYEAPEPWGPWRTVYFTRSWDVGPGETAGFPTKWMSADGRTAHLTFSGKDCFSVRRARFVVPVEAE